MSPQTKRALFPLRSPRTFTQLWWPVTLMAIAVDGYFEAFFACLNPTGASDEH